jgi:hypothetical protein
MTDMPARTTFIVASDRDALMLEKLAGIEQAIEGLVPLLAKIVTQLETQTEKQQVPIATYAHLYALPEPGPPEGELVADAAHLAAARPVGWVRRFFLKRTAP